MRMSEKKLVLVNQMDSFLKEHHHIICRDSKSLRMLGKRVDEKDFNINSDYLKMMQRLSYVRITEVMKELHSNQFALSSVHSMFANKAIINAIAFNIASNR